ncbi:peptide chain release factor N(5)-glutamine methyltransferase [Winogradskyella alexanderae]|uniref:Release factor glutamine methyltransferase n=1 Tax=Winogradskyella alexanderae TaxID=2877123 RepID=A0ABS7XTE9_9FLAO|nr:peptide chain release factor N(5)-glutamine methyltransferase [Winogradskyella alexanderae]MCA0133065.1 peptide chain release factor N(5)-glutamine methyltransferase [Winogradskyella alexanderae]
MKAVDIKAIFHKELDAIYGANEVTSFFYLCLTHYLNIQRFQLAIQPELTLSKQETDFFLKALEALKLQEPIQYILGETEFYGLTFKVNKNVLIPRQETEELVDLIIKSSEIKRKQALRVLDIGTGSGCIAISLAKHIPSATVFALDISKQALDVAKENAKINEVEIQFVCADILDENNRYSRFEGLEFDIIVSNPPYVRLSEKSEIMPNVLEHEPHLALFVRDKDPLIFYRAITDFAKKKLKPKGQLYFEINQYLGKETKQLLIDADFTAIELFEDLNSNQRMLKGTKK